MKIVYYEVSLKNKNYLLFNISKQRKRVCRHTVLKVKNVCRLPIIMIKILYILYTRIIKVFGENIHC